MEINSPEDKSVNPAFFELLSESDRQGYIDLRNELMSSDTKFKRYKRITSLRDALYAIHKYCSRNSNDDWKRYLVCGVCWMGWDIAINTRQLRLLINKCKSSINGALAKMGYSTAPIKTEGSSSLIKAIPFLKGNFVELRMWTIRRRQIASPLPSNRIGYISPLPATHQSTISPQPYFPPMPQFIPPVCRSEITAIFGVPESSLSPSEPLDPNPAAATPDPAERHVQILEPPQKECSYDKHKEMYQDVCACYPLDWLIDDDNEKDEFLTFG